MESSYWELAPDAAGADTGPAMSKENVEIMRRGWDAWLHRDLDAMAALWDPDVVWKTEHFHNWPESGYRGHEGIRQFLSEWLDV